MEEQNVPTPNITMAEEIAVEYADIMDRMVDLIKRLTSELAQYRRMDKEERELEALLKRTGGGRRCGNQ